MKPGATRTRAVMVGPEGKVQGGVAAVVNACRDAGLFEGGRVRCISSFSEGRGLAKLARAFAAWRQYLQVLRAGEGEVLHVHVSSRASFWRKAVFIWTAKLARRKVVFHLHGGGFRAFVEGLAWPARTIALATIRRSDQLLYLSSEVGRWLQVVAPTVPGRWWPNPVPLGLFGAAADREEAPTVLYLGALLPAKGLSDLLEGFARLREARPGAQLVVGGAGPELGALQARAARLGLGDSVSFAGWLDGPAKARQLRRARVFVLPSLMEAQPMVILEAMASRTPVISTAVGGVPDLIDDGSDGLLVPPGQPELLAQALLRLWDDPRLRAQLSERAFLKVQARHRADQVCAALLALYEELASGSAPLAQEER